ncbi:MAG: polyamine aminopropyltransferase [Syntrophales bacterium]
MLPWQLLDSMQVPGENTYLRLYRRGGEFSIRLDGSELMNSRVHGSEDAMAELACARISSLPCPRVLIGGLGMGYTLAAALNRLGPESRVVVAELVPAVAAWNRGPLAALAGHPLADDRVTVREVDVAHILRAEQRAYDAILLDVDNGPQGLTRKSNAWLYTPTGLEAVFTALRPAGVFALWSAGPERAFALLLRKRGFVVAEERVRARGSRGGYHTIWIAGRAA